MNDISFKSNYGAINSPELQRRLESQENFTGYTTDRLKEDAVEIGNKAKKEVKKNWIVKALNDIGVEDPKKLFTSIGLVIATTIGLAFLGNKMSNKTADFGLKVDEFAKNSKIYQGISNFFKSGKDKTVDFLKKFKTTNNILETFKTNRARQKFDPVRGYGKGFVSIFSLTPPDILKHAFEKSAKKMANGGKVKDEQLIEAGKNIMKKLVGEQKASDLAEAVVKGKLNKNGIKIEGNKELCEAISNAMRSHLGCEKDNQKFLDALKGLQKGEFNGEKIPELIGVDMTDKSLMGPISAWWPVNIVNSIGKKIRGDKWKGFARGNFGDSMVKFNVVNGSLAETKLGSLAQQITTIPCESISNFVNDKSGLGFFLCAMYVGLFNNAQDAPKGKKVATVADDLGYNKPIVDDSGEIDIKDRKTSCYC